jgi:hypothetical protein
MFAVFAENFQGFPEEWQVKKNADKIKCNVTLQT